MEFSYKIRDGQGRVQEAIAQAESQAILRTRLLSRGFEVLEIVEKTGLTYTLLNAWERFTGLFEQVTLKDMVVFSRQFAAMVSAGVAMLRTLNIIVEQCPNKKMKST